ncbi:hypothetical protein F441_22596 [Phytophthora nicotianae CJ01A1]|uniref:Uncharacterized protein n=3 Tax=Phytophthora nicotianae TaxID=4792 RepID=W2FVC7_PHYNI|nr:hypothetical protein L915_19218 [Phytophthora nicotianae]ETL27323.1 hypothetical protein L916_19112 [Phytophthora nicotianae]ETO62330.1 hypothetical protein F444_19746 [Phytophthora nicotianae P1976]ETO99979.1 hypothetical protein F441_22596 [Phytophthora nicotianae CJ01A1]
MSFDLSITTERPKDISNTFKDLFPVHEVVFQQDIEWRNQKNESESVPLLA